MLNPVLLNPLLRSAAHWAVAADEGEPALDVHARVLVQLGDESGQVRLAFRPAQARQMAVTLMQAAETAQLAARKQAREQVQAPAASSSPPDAPAVPPSERA